METESGYMQVSPWLTVLTKCQETLKKLLSEFGMTPASRTRVRVETEKKMKNEFDGI